MMDTSTKKEGKIMNFAQQLSQKFRREIPSSDIPLDEIHLMRFPANGFSRGSGNESLVYSPSLNKFFEKDVYRADEIMVELGRAFPEETLYREVSKEVAQVKVLCAQERIRPKDRESCLKAGLILDSRISISQSENGLSVAIKGNTESPFHFREGDLKEQIQNAGKFIWCVSVLTN